MSLRHCVLVAILALAASAACAATSHATARTPAATLELTNRAVDLEGAITLAAARKTIGRLLELDAKGTQPIFLRINAHGESVEAALAIGDAIRALRSPVHAVVESRAYGAAALVALTCARLYVFPSAVLLLSPVVAVSEEIKLPEDKQPPEAFAKAYTTRIHRELARRLGMSVEQYEQRVADDWWLSAEDAVKARVAHQIVDAIRYRELVTETTETKRILETKDRRRPTTD